MRASTTAKVSVRGGSQTALAVRIFSVRAAGEDLAEVLKAREFGCESRVGPTALETARVQSPHGKTAQDVCRYYLKIAEENADADEKKYLPLVRRRIEEGNLSNLIRQRVERRAEKTVLREAIVDVYSKLINCLRVNEPF